MSKVKEDKLSNLDLTVKDIYMAGYMDNECGEKVRMDKIENGILLIRQAIADEIREKVGEKFVNEQNFSPFADVINDSEVRRQAHNSCLAQVLKAVKGSE